MSGAIASSPAATLFLAGSSSSSPRRRRSRVSGVWWHLYGGTGLRLHWERRGLVRDGAVVCSASAAGGEDGVAKAKTKSAGSSKAVAVQGSTAKVDTFPPFFLEPSLRLLAHVFQTFRSCHFDILTTFRDLIIVCVPERAIS